MFEIQFRKFTETLLAINCYPYAVPEQCTLPAAIYNIVGGGVSKQASINSEKTDIQSVEIDVTLLSTEYDMTYAEMKAKLQDTFQRVSAAQMDGVKLLATKIQITKSEKTNGLFVTKYKITLLINNK